MRFFDLPNITLALRFFFAHFPLFVQLGALSSVITTLIYLLDSLAPGAVMNFFSFVMSFLCNISIFTLTNYLIYQRYNHVPGSLAEFSAVVRERFSNIAYMYMRVLLVILGYFVVAMLPIGLASATQNSVVITATLIPVLALWVLMCLRYVLVPYVALFQPNATYAQARDFSVQYITPRNWRVLLSFFLLTLLPMVLSIAVGFGTETEQSLITYFCISMGLGILYAPVSVLCFFFYMEARERTPR